MNSLLLEAEAISLKLSIKYKEEEGGIRPGVQNYREIPTGFELLSNPWGRSAAVVAGSWKEPLPEAQARLGRGALISYGGSVPPCPQELHHNSNLGFLHMKEKYVVNLLVVSIHTPVFNVH